MQSNPKEIYDLTSKRTGEDLQSYKDIGSFVFGQLYKELRRPKSLIIKLKGIGTWHLRKKRMEIAIHHLDPDFTNVPVFNHPLAQQEWENRLERHNIFIERLKEYEKYIELRNNIRKIRYETQVILPSQKES